MLGIVEALAEDHLHIPAELKIRLGLLVSDVFFWFFCCWFCFCFLGGFWLLLLGYVATKVTSRRATTTCDWLKMILQSILCAWNLCILLRVKVSCSNLNSQSYRLHSLFTYKPFNLNALNTDKCRLPCVIWFVEFLTCMT